MTTWRRGRWFTLGGSGVIPRWPQLRLHFWGYGKDRLLDVQFDPGRWYRDRRAARGDYSKGEYWERFILWPRPRKVKMWG